MVGIPLASGRPTSCATSKRIIRISYRAGDIKGELKGIRSDMDALRVLMKTATDNADFARVRKLEENLARANKHIRILEKREKAYLKEKEKAERVQRLNKLSGKEVRKATGSTSSSSASAVSHPPQVEKSIEVHYDRHQCARGGKTKKKPFTSFKASSR